MQPGRSIIDPVQTIIYVNVAVYIFSLLINPSSLTGSFHPLLFLSPTEHSLFLLGATGTLPIDHFGRWWTLISASYLHGGVLHLLFNMMAFYQLGPFILLEYGAYRLFTIYTLSGVGGFFISYFVGVPFTIGASAAICGLIGAILYFGKSRGGFYGDSIYRQALGWVVGLILFGLLLPGINNWAHGGGLVTGMAVSFLLGYEEKKRENAFHRLLAWICFFITALIVGGNIIRVLYFILVLK